MSTANAQFERGEYYKAAATYRRVYNKKSSLKERSLRAIIAQKMGICYEKINIPSRASAAYTNAIRYKNKDSLIYLSLAQCLHKEGRYKEAIAQYKLFLSFDSTHLTALNGLSGAEKAQELKKNKTRYEVKKVDILNSRRSDFSPMLLGTKNDQLYFTTTNDHATGSDKSDITGLKPADIYFSKINEKGIWQKPEPAEGDINTEFDEGTPAFTSDGNTMYFTRARLDATRATSTEIFKSTRSGGKWSTAEKVEIAEDTISVFAHPAVSPDDAYLYFVSDMPGSIGGKDIWRISIADSKLGAVENLGDQINTPADELFPTFDNKGFLYFSSNGHPGLGGLDIFKARLDEWGYWHIMNMKAPINSQADDFGMTFLTIDDDEGGFFSSNRGDGRGYDHLYSFYLPSIKVLIKGQVSNKDEEIIPGAIVRVVGMDGSNHKIITKQDGTFEVKIDRGIRYVLMAGAKGYLNDKEEFRSDNDDSDATYQVDFVLSSINKPVLIENIFYDFDKATLRPESSLALDELIGLLNNNPNVTIELLAHTDRKGTDNYNINLSQERAKTVVDYLVKGGIAQNRLFPIGYGKSKPKIITSLLHKKYPFFEEGQILGETFIETLSPEQQEIADQINRRTEFQVKDTTYGLE